MEVPQMLYSIADPALIETIVGELKSQGTFDQFRKECIADVDTKPAYQNLHQRVETTVSNFLEERTWRPDLNKNQLRDSLRKHIHEMGFLETGVERIVDQVVNPKVHSVFLPQVEDVVYRVQGIPKPEKKPTANTSTAMGSTSKNGGMFNASLLSQPPPFLPGLSFLPPALQNHMQKPPDLDDLLPQDLDPVSAESSDESQNNSEPKLELKSFIKEEDNGIIKNHDDSMDSQLSGISDLTSHGSDKPSFETQEKNVAESQIVNEESNLSNVSSNSRLSCEPAKSSVQKTKGDETEETKEVLESKHSYEQQEPNEKSPVSSRSPLMHYSDQFSKEEEVATSAAHEFQEEVLDSCVKEEGIDGQATYPRGVSDNMKVEIRLPENDHFKSSPGSDSTHGKYCAKDDRNSLIVDETSTAHSEDSQYSGSSDNKLHIDELRDFNSQSGNSQQNEDEQSSMKSLYVSTPSKDSAKIKAVVENIVEASEEARHGFDDSQDALERPPLPWTPQTPAESSPIRPPLPPLPPMPPPSSCLSAGERPPLPPENQDKAQEVLPPLPPTTCDKDYTSERPPPPPSPFSDNLDTAVKEPTPPTTPFEDTYLYKKSHSQSPVGTNACVSKTFDPDEVLNSPTTHSGVSGERSPHPAGDEYSSEKPPLPPSPSLGDALAADALSAAETPHVCDTYHAGAPPPLPPTPPLGNSYDSERPPPPPTPPLDDLLAQGIRPPTPQAISLKSTTPPLPEAEFSRESNMSPPYEEGALPKTPRWEPASPRRENVEQRDISSCFPGLEGLGGSAPSQEQQSLQMSSKVDDEDCNDSQSGSDDMQLAWSPLSAHGDQADEEGSERHVSCDINQKLSFISNSPLEKSKLNLEHHTETKKEDKHRSVDKYEHGHRHRAQDRSREGKSKERHKEETRSHKESSCSSKRHDGKSSKHKESRDRRDSGSRYRHDEKNRSDKDRDRHSTSHHRGDDRKRDDKREDRDRSSSSKHKSSRTDDRHRHRDRERKNSSTRHEDKSHEKSCKTEDKSKSSSKLYLSDRDRKDRERREKDIKDRERRSEKDKDRSSRDSSRHDEKKREKERDKDKKEKSSNVCKPNNENRSPDRDSNNGSTFGGNNQTTIGLSKKDSHIQDNSYQESNKVSGSSDSNDKPSESCQHSNYVPELASVSCPMNQSVSPPSSLPFKKRPLLQESVLKEGLPSSRLILKIKKLRESTEKSQDARNKRQRAIRRLESKSVRNLDRITQSSSKENYDSDSPPPYCGSPFKYFVSDWPTKSDDEAFLAYVQNLEGSQNLSELSDFSDSDSEEEHSFTFDDSNNAHGIVDESLKLSLSVLTDHQDHKVPHSSSRSEYPSAHQKKGKVMVNKVKRPSKNRSRQRKTPENEIEVKRRRLNSNQATDQPPLEQKSRRARKPNKRYSNDEFTSHFDCEEFEFPEEESSKVVRSDKTSQSVPNITLHYDNSEIAISDEEIESKKVVNDEVDHSEKEDTKSSTLAHGGPALVLGQSKQSAISSWKQDSYNSNSEDEMECSTNESDLIGTALKNLMMESGFSRPEEAPGFERQSFSSHPNTSDSLARMQKSSILLPGVKRVGLSKNFKGNKNFSIKPSRKLNVAVSCSEFSFPSTAENGQENGSSWKLNAVPEIQPESTMRKLGLSRVKQHYSSDDLYKPRRFLGLTSKRRKVIS